MLPGIGINYLIWLDKHKFGIWAFAVATAFIPGFMSSAIVGRWAVIAIGIPLVGQIGFRFPPLIQYALAMGLAWASASMLITPYPKDAILQLFFMFVLVGVMGAASQMKSLDDALSGLCLGVGVSSAFCFYALPFEWGHPLVTQIPNQYAGLFFNSEVLVELSAPLLVWSIVSRRWDLAAATVVPLLLNVSRISIFVVVVGLLYAYRPRSKRVWALAAIAGLAIMVAGVWHFTTIDSAKVGSAALRLLDWMVTAMAISPLGHGIGWFRITHGGEEFSHSDVLQSMAELGLGSLCFAVIPVYIFRRFGGSYAERAAFVVICIELLISFPLHVPATAFLAALLAGYLACDRAVVLRVQPDGGIQDGADGQPYSAVSRRGFGGGGRFNCMVSVRRAVAGLSPMGAEIGLRQGDR